MFLFACFAFPCMSKAYNIGPNLLENLYMSETCSTYSVSHVVQDISEYLVSLMQEIIDKRRQEVTLRKPEMRREIGDQDSEKQQDASITSR